MNDNLKDKLSKIKSGKPSKWKEDAEFRLNNRWLEYSSQIARRIIALIKEDKELNQVKLAQASGLKTQSISRILQGRENLTLETIYKLSQALNYELISFPPYEFNTQTIKQNSISLSDYFNSLKSIINSELNSESKGITVNSDVENSGFGNPLYHILSKTG